MVTDIGLVEVTEVTVPSPFAEKVSQSDAVKYPPVEVEAAAIEIEGVEVGLVIVINRSEDATEVTVPEPPEPVVSIVATSELILKVPLETIILLIPVCVGVPSTSVTVNGGRIGLLIVCRHPSLALALRKCLYRFA